MGLKYGLDKLPGRNRKVLIQNTEETEKIKETKRLEKINS